MFPGSSCSLWAGGSVNGAKEEIAYVTRCFHWCGDQKAIQHMEEGSTRGLGRTFRPGVVFGDCLVPPCCLVHLLPRAGLDKSFVHR